jgi:hypothetical protein
MSDQLIAPAAAGPEAPRSLGTWRVPLLQAVVIVVAFAVVGALCGLLWESVWTPAQGEVVKHVWYPFSWDRAQPTYFAGAAWYVVIGFAAGLVLGALSALLLDRAELVTLVAAVAGGLLAAYLMRVVGLHRAPGDPQSIAKTAADGTKLPSDLSAGSGWLVLGFPGGALTSVGVIFLTLAKRGGRPVPASEANLPDPAVEPPSRG